MDCIDKFGVVLTSITQLNIALEKSTVDAELVKHGHWIEVQRIHETDHTAICECSLCGDTVWVYDGQRAWNYCPTCGAKMDGAET